MSTLAGRFDVAERAIGLISLSQPNSKIAVRVRLLHFIPFYLPT